MSYSAQAELKESSRACASNTFGARVGKQCFEKSHSQIVICTFYSEAMVKPCWDTSTPLEFNVWEHQNEADIEVRCRRKLTSEYNIPDGTADAVRAAKLPGLLDPLAAPPGVARTKQDDHVQ